MSEAACFLLASYSSPDVIKELEEELIADKENFPLSVHLAVKLARSKSIIASIDEPFHTSIVFAVYKEHNRIRKPTEHQHGEDFLFRKISQLKWLFDEYPGLSWDLTIVDDGCPEHTGRIAQRIVEAKCSGEAVQVLFLENAIQQGLPVARSMHSVLDSNKGGAIQYGLWTAVKQSKKNHIVVFTDADLSTHLGQIGLLIDGIINQGGDAAIGSRREAASLVVKKGIRNSRGKLFIYLWKRLIPLPNYIVDTQCGFKAFTADTVRTIVSNLIETRFAFDIELLLKTELRRKGSVVTVPIAWIDSEVGSSTTELSPYLSMLKSVVKIYRHYLAENRESAQFANFIEALDESSWNTLVDNIPGEITDRNPKEFGNFAGIQASDLQRIAYESPDFSQGS